jgi:hypothetical protein
VCKKRNNDAKMRLDPSYDSTMEDLMWPTEALQLMPVIEPFRNRLHVLKGLVSRLPVYH